AVAGHRPRRDRRRAHRDDDRVPVALRDHVGRGELDVARGRVDRRAAAHRDAPDPRRTRGRPLMRRRLVVALLAVGAVLLGVVVNVVDARLLPYGPTGATGEAGEDVGALPSLVHVSAVRVAETVREPRLDERGVPVAGGGLGVVVTLSYASEDRFRVPSRGRIVLRAGDGREFPVSARSGLTTWPAGPDTWVRGDLAFEVAPDAVEHLTLMFDPGLQIYGPMPMPYARIPLDLADVEVLDAAELGPPVELAVGER